MPAQLVLCACPDAQVAASLARELVEDRLAACATVLPGARSIYRWEDALHEDAEVLLLLKTWADRTPALGERIRARHPYELPEVIAVEACAGLPAYLDWIHDQTRPPPGPAA